MDDWDFEDLLEWDDEDEEEERTELLYDVAKELADTLFLSSDQHLPDAGEAYRLGYLNARAWWPLVLQLDELVEMGPVFDLLDELDGLLAIPGLPTQVLEDPLGFLEIALEGSLPREPSGRKVNSRRLVKIGLAVVRLAGAFPEVARSAVRAWANVQRQLSGALSMPERHEDLADFLDAHNLPPAVMGFSMLIAMTLMRWPERAEGLSLPPDFLEAEVFSDVLANWEALPASPRVTEEGIGEAEAFFAQGQLAHTLARLGMADELDSDHVGDPETAVAYSRLSRAVLWLHNQCRSCSERDEVTCLVATLKRGTPPSPLLDVASEIASKGHIAGCIHYPEFSAPA